MRSLGPKCLLKLRHETILSRQLRILSKKFPLATIKIITGFKHDRIVKYVKSLNYHNVLLCLNDFHEELPPSYGIARYHDYKKATLIIPGDLVFNEDLFSFDFDDTGIITTKRYMEQGDVGVSDVDGFVGRFSYALPEKYGQISYLTSSDAEIFCDLASIEKNRNLLTFELFNIMSDAVTMFKIYRPKNGKILDVDKPVDLVKAAKIV